MNKVSGTALVAVGVGVTIGAVALAGFGLQEWRKAEARSVCDGVVSEIEQIQKLPQREQMGKIASWDSSKITECLTRARAIPFKDAAFQARIVEMERIVALMPMIQGLAGFVDAFQGSGQPISSQANASAVPTAVTSPVASPVLVSAPTPAPSPTVAIQPAAAPAFDTMPPCDQLDAVAKSGKSVAEFVKADWAKYGGVGSICAWHQPQIDVAYRLLNPPAPARTTTARRSSNSSGSTSGGSSTVVIREAPAPRWNNCNGIQEPGESYSASCHRSQVLNDAGLGNARTQGIDDRPPMIDPGFSGHPNGAREGAANGYSSSN